MISNHRARASGCALTLSALALEFDAPAQSAMRALRSGKLAVDEKTVDLTGERTFLVDGNGVSYAVDKSGNLCEVATSPKP